MPVRETLLKDEHPNEAELRQAIVTELRTPRDSGEPVIIVERSRPMSIHLFAVWSKFENMDQYIRSRILLDAFKEARGEDEAQLVTVSMGLTPAEASRMGIG